MVEDTLKKLEQRLASSESLSDEARDSLRSLVEELRAEIEQIEDSEQAESIAAFTESSAREALRSAQDEDLLELSMQGLRSSTRSFEASHPKLVTVVNGICQQLSSLGI